MLPGLSLLPTFLNPSLFLNVSCFCRFASPMFKPAPRIVRTISINLQ